MLVQKGLRSFQYRILAIKGLFFMGQQYALKQDFEDRIYRLLNKWRIYDNLNFGIHRIDANWLQVVNKNAFGEIQQRLWKIRYKEDTLKEVYHEFDLALREFAL